MFKTSKKPNPLKSSIQAKKPTFCKESTNLATLMTGGYYHAIRMISTFETARANSYEKACELATYKEKNIDIVGAITAIQAVKCIFYDNFEHLNHLQNCLDAKEAEGESRQQTALNYWLMNCAYQNFTYYCVVFICEYLFSSKYKYVRSFEEVMKSIRNADGSFTYFKDTIHEVTVR